ncbi:MAG: hypothetical protein WAV15_03240 [Minisyncoccia bacterium]
METRKTEKEQWQEKTALAKNFQLTPDMSGDFTRLRSTLGLHHHFTGPATPQRIEEFVVGKIEEERGMQQSREASPAETSGKGYGAEEAQSKAEYFTESLRLLERFLARHGGDNARARLGIEKDEALG